MKPSPISALVANLAPNASHTTYIGHSSKRNLTSAPKSSTLPRLSIILLLIASLIRPSESISCDVARTKCAYRTGCGHSLHSYMVECSSLIGGKTDRCHTRCQNALVALVSSEEGDDLVNCDCEGSKHCEKSKQRIEVCRSAVYSATAKDSIVSCTTARWICMSDTLCRTALEYYNVYCRGLFHGNKCSYRCKNSLSILERQEKAAKLRTCYCDGTEEFPCKRVKYNTERYCYGRNPFPIGTDPHSSSNNIDLMLGSEQYGHHKRHQHKARENGSTGAAAVATSSSLLTLLMAILIGIFAIQYR